MAAVTICSDLLGLQLFLGIHTQTYVLEYIIFRCCIKIIQEKRINMIDHELKIMLVSLYFCTGFKLLILSFVLFFNLKTKCMPLFLPGKPCLSWPGFLSVGSHLSPEFHIASGTTEESRQWVQNRPQFPPHTHLQGFNHGPDFIKKNNNNCQKKWC